MTESTDVPQTDPNTLDHSICCLSRSVRRRILTTLATEDPGDTVEFVFAAFTSDGADAGVSRAALYHTRHPHLARPGLVEWDRDSGTVTRGPTFEDVRPLVTLLEERHQKLPGTWP